MNSVSRGKVNISARELYQALHLFGLFPSSHINEAVLDILKALTEQLSDIKRLENELHELKGHYPSYIGLQGEINELMAENEIDDIEDATKALKKLKLFSDEWNFEWQKRDWSRVSEKPEMLTAVSILTSGIVSVLDQMYPSDQEYVRNEAYNFCQRYCVSLMVPWMNWE